MQTLLLHLTENPYELVSKDTHKWGTLIAAYSGMRLNEVAQMLVTDVKQVDEVWLFDVTEEGGHGKSLKNASSWRRVPVHARLLELGFLDFLEQQRDRGDRLFPDLPYSAKNGYGRNLGRWFNDSLLPKLSLRRDGLVFHSLRHSVITRLSQSDVPEAHVKAIVGHVQTGVTYSTYFKEGFLPAQLQAAMNKLSFD
jgi:integrase